MNAIYSEVFQKKYLCYFYRLKRCFRCFLKKCKPQYFRWWTDEHLVVLFVLVRAGLSPLEVYWIYYFVMELWPSVRLFKYTVDLRDFYEFLKIQKKKKWKRWKKSRRKCQENIFELFFLIFGLVAQMMTAKMQLVWC